MAHTRVREAQVDDIGTDVGGVYNPAITASGGPGPVGRRRTWTGTTSASGATPMIPNPLSAAAMMPATCVPWSNS